MLARLSLLGIGRSTQLTKHDQYRNEITQHLQVLKINDLAIKKILDTVDKMPGSIHLLGALNFLTELKDEKYVCENYYDHSEYLAEFFSTLSNLGFFAVSYYYKDLAALFAGTFSALSHAIPLKRLNELEKIAAMAVFFKMISNYDVLMSHSAIANIGLATVSLGALDMLSGKSLANNFGPSFHAAWHLAASFTLYKINQGQFTVSNNDLTNIASAVLQNRIPGFLKPYYNVIMDNVMSYTKVNQCNIL